MRSAPRRWARFIAFVAIPTSLLAIHAVLLQALATEQTVAKLFAAGGGAGDLIVAVGFLAVRLTLYLLGPGLALYALCTPLVRSRRASVRGMKSPSHGAHDRRNARGAA